MHPHPGDSVSHAKPEASCIIYFEGKKIFSGKELTADYDSLRAEAKQQLLTAIHDADTRLKQGLTASVDKTVAAADAALEQLVHTELDGYGDLLSRLRIKAEARLATVEQQIDSKRAEMLAQLDQELAAERTKRLTAITDQIEDVIVGYIAGSLGKQVDLGAQMGYIITTLDQHKDAIKKDVSGQ